MLGHMLPTTKRVCLRMMSIQGTCDPEEERGTTALLEVLDPAAPFLIREPIDPSFSFNQPARFGVTYTLESPVTRENIQE